MIIGGFRPCSFIDWPGRLAAVVFTHGCNLRCRYCHNPWLLAGAPATRIDEAAVMALLGRRRGLLDGVVVSGGEPTLQAGLPAFLARVRAMGFPVKLDTNGTRPAMVAELLDRRLIDHLAVDLKAGPDEAGWLCGEPAQSELARQCLQAALRAGIEHEVRTTLVSPVHTAASLEALVPWAAGARTWAFQRFRPGGVLDPDAALGSPTAQILDAAEVVAHSRGMRVVRR